jgi:hypothetical protein
MADPNLPVFIIPLRPLPQIRPDPPLPEVIEAPPPPAGLDPRSPLDTDEPEGKLAAILDGLPDIRRHHLPTAESHLHYRWDYSQHTGAHQRLVSDRICTFVRNQRHLYRYFEQHLPVNAPVQPLPEARLLNRLTGHVITAAVVYHSVLLWSGYKRTSSPETPVTARLHSYQLAISYYVRFREAYQQDPDQWAAVSQCGGLTVYKCGSAPGAQHILVRRT